MKIYDKLKAALLAKTPKPADIAAALADVEKILADARAERDGLAAGRRAALLDGALAAHSAKVAAMTERIETATAFRDELAAKRDELAAAAVEGQRRKRYDAAKALADAAAAALPGAYTAIVAQTHAMLRDLAEAQAAIEAVNNDLPAGAERLPDPEMVVRGIAGSPSRMVSEAVVTLWRHPMTMKPVTDPDISARIEDAGHGRGRVSGTAGPYPTTPLEGFIRRRYRKTTRTEHVNGQWPSALSHEIKLPALYAPGEGRSAVPAWSRDAFTHNFGPVALLAELDALRGTCDPPPAAKPATTVDYEELPGDEQDKLPPLPEPAQQEPSGRHVIRSEYMERKT